MCKETGWWNRAHSEPAQICLCCSDATRSIICTSNPADSYQTRSSALCLVSNLTPFVMQTEVSPVLLGYWAHDDVFTTQLSHIHSAVMLVTAVASWMGWKRTEPKTDFNCEDLKSGSFYCHKNPLNCSTAIICILLEWYYSYHVELTLKCVGHIINIGLYM